MIIAEYSSICLKMNLPGAHSWQLPVHVRSTESQEEPRIVSADRIVQLRALMYNADLIGRPNVVFTPHIAFNSVEEVKRINQTTVENIKLSWLINR